MKKIIFLILLCASFISLNAQRETYSIEYENHKVGVFNPEWEINHTLNPNKYEHITGFFREELAKTIIETVKSKQVKIYDIRKRELNLDTVINRIIEFERIHFNHILGKDTALNYIIPFISAYDFEEGVRYDYQNLSIEKKVLAYCPYIVRYKNFNGENNDSIHMPLFWIFPKDTATNNNGKQTTNTIFFIPDTVLSVLQLKYPVKMPFTSSIFDNVQGKKIKVYHSNGSEFKTPKEIDDLFILSKSVEIYDETTDKEIFKTVYSDIVPEDIEAIRIAENWAINTSTLEILKTVQYFLPLYKYDEDFYTQLGVRIWNKPKRNL